MDDKALQMLMAAARSYGKSSGFGAPTVPITNTSLNSDDPTAKRARLEETVRRLRARLTDQNVDPQERAYIEVQLRQAEDELRRLTDEPFLKRDSGKNFTSGYVRKGP